MAALNGDNEILVLHVTALAEPAIMPIYSSCQAYIILLTSEKIGISAEYSDFFNIFSSDLATKLLEHNRINDHSIDLLDNKQLFYDPIYTLGLVELKTLKIYIKANKASSFIKLFKFFTNVLILFTQKKDNSLHLYVNY